MMQADDPVVEFPEDDEWGHRHANTATTDGPIDIETEAVGVSIGNGDAAKPAQASNVRASQEDGRTGNATNGVLSQTKGAVLFCASISITVHDLSRE